MMRAACPNCGSGGEWITGFEWAGRKNSGIGQTDGPCSRRCALQIEYAGQITAGRLSVEGGRLA